MIKVIKWGVSGRPLAVAREDFAQGLVGGEKGDEPQRAKPHDEIKGIC